MSIFFKEFKEFAMKGNVMDMAIGVIIGAAFGKIVTSLVSDIIMPLIGLLVGGIDFKEWKWVLSPAQMNADGSVAKAAVSVNYGVFLQTVLDFIIVALCIFIVIKAINKASEAIKKAKGIEAPKPAEPVTPEDTLLLREIRDSLKKSDK
jgi:large conductance mechanosensitive channel protein